MNGSPNAEQKRYQNIELRELFREMHGTGCEIHHIFGSKTTFKLLKEAGIKKAGEWFVIAMSKEEHDAIDKYSFEAERGLFLKQLRDYEKYFEKPSPVPQEVIDYYKLMTSKHQGLKNWNASQ